MFLGEVVSFVNLYRFINLAISRSNIIRDLISPYILLFLNLLLGTLIGLKWISRSIKTMLFIRRHLIDRIITSRLNIYN